VAGRALELLTAAPALLAEGSVVERVRRGAPGRLHPELLTAALALQPEGRALLESLWRGYLAVACSAGLPIVLLTPTWRANREAVARAGLSGEALSRANVAVLEALRGEHAAAGGGPVLMAGLLGPAGDAYDPRAALGEREAAELHSGQARLLAEAGVDFLTAQTLPALSEARGLARAMAGRGVPYLLSFVVRTDRVLLDGTPLEAAIEAIDRDVRPAPLAYTLNCVHPAPCREALVAVRTRAGGAVERVVGLQANGSALPPEALDGSDALHSDEPGPWGAAMAALARKLGLRLLGGCCGTDERHIAAIAAHL
jgi:homocysteine S-methyltransferase